MAALAGKVGAFYVQKPNSLNFSDAGQYVTVTDPATGILDFTYTDAFSVEAWVRPQDGYSDFLVITKGGDNVGYQMGVLSTGVPFVVVRNAADTDFANSTTTVNDGLWHHLVGVTNPGTSVHMYVDGEDNTDSITQNLASSAANASDFIIGDKSTASTSDVNTGMVRIWNKALSATQVSDLADGNFPAGSRDAVIGEWLLVEGSGSDVYDSSSQGNNGVATGYPRWHNTMYDEVAAENVGSGDGSETVFNTSFTDVDNKNLTVTVDSVASLLGTDFEMTPKGTITFNTAPASGNILVTYRHYPIVLEAGGFINWSLDYTADALEITDFISNGSREYIGGLVTWTATAERHWVNRLTDNMLGNKFIVKFFHNEPTDQYLNGWGLITGLHPSVAVEGLVDESLDIQGTHFLGVESGR